MQPIQYGAATKQLVNSVTHR